MDRAARVATFRALHVPGDPFVLANAWDLGSARALAGLGAKALATSSAAHAWTLGLPDGGRLPLDEVIGHVGDLADATPLPLNADLEHGFGRSPDDVAACIRAAAEAGAAGGSIEDIDLPGTSAFDRARAVARIAAAAEAARDADFVLTARADGLLTGAYDADEAIARLEAFAEAGAEVLYAPGLPDADAMRRAVGIGKPVNALAFGPWLETDLAGWAELGVARVSLGATLAGVAWRAVLDAAGPMLTGGDFSGARGKSARELTELMATGSA